jgi:hypothetical protein
MRLHQQSSHRWSHARRTRRKASPTAEALEERALLAQVTVIPGMGPLTNLPLSNLPLSNLPLSNLTFQSVGTSSTPTPGGTTTTRPGLARTGSFSFVFAGGGGPNVRAFTMSTRFPGLGRTFLPAGPPSLVRMDLRSHAVPASPGTLAVAPNSMPTPLPATSPMAALAVGGHHGHHHHHSHHHH